MQAAQDDFRYTCVCVQLSARASRATSCWLWRQGNKPQYTNMTYFLHALQHSMQNHKACGTCKDAPHGCRQLARLLPYAGICTTA